ncbi:uncharacterized protein THITE_2122729 [Thermothielavioides terrestris NRRL 8126]|uniref:Uncharacterized protein n=1 Tax=Thermothielavioides terrestris (strain ATCC 38088 / NRRL 8126) TaxID=578455 RepID=G2RE03_THETT|nr:uncharacterized protein THITE_2122729 [Thermothielavioides terrestris NRRL 8126]AEO70886.1 hypothetical protein THITE_2122729 [Thermothielavioides terrestris NRRL 8126]
MSVTGDCCPFGYLCDPATDVQCRLTLKLSEVVQTVTTTVGTWTETLTRTLVQGPTRTAVGRLAEITSASSGSGGGGLSGAQIGGIVAGVVGGLLLIAAAVFVVLRLKARRRETESGTGEGTSAVETRELDGQGLERAELPSTSDKQPVEVDAGHLGHELEG